MKIYCVINIHLDMNKNNESIEEKILADFYQQCFNRYSSSFVAPITKTIENEWQIVLSSVKDAYPISRDITNFFQSKRITTYIGIGIGTISTKEDQDTRYMDGQAFIMARNSLEIALTNKTGYKKCIPTPDCKIYLLGFDEFHNNEPYSRDHYLNLLIQNNETLIQKITPKQLHVISLYETYGSYNEIIQAYPNMSKGNISDKLTASNYWLINQNISTVQEFMELYQSEIENIGR